LESAQASHDLLRERGEAQHREHTRRRERVVVRDGDEQLIEREGGGEGRERREKDESGGRGDAEQSCGKRDRVGRNELD
jgi:hypothetical protein